MKSLLVVLTALLLPLSVSATDVRIQCDRWMPLNGTPQEQPPGYAIELLVEVFAEQPTDTITYTLEPWTTSIANATKGEADAVIGAAKDEAPRLLFPKEPIAHITYGFWALKDNRFTYSADALRTARIGVIKGYTYWPALDKLVQDKSSNITVYGGDNPLTDAIAGLVNGDIELFPEFKPVFAWALKEQELDPNDFVSKFEADGGLIYVAFTNSAHGQELATKWDERIAAMRRTGKLQEILSRYGVTDWAK